MNEADLRYFLDKDIWTYLRLKNGYFYKCKIINVSESSFTIEDKFGLVSKFNISDIDILSEWKDKGGKNNGKP